MDTENIDVSSEQESMSREQMLSELFEYWMRVVTVSELLEVYEHQLKVDYTLVSDRALQAEYKRTICHG